MQPERKSTQQGKQHSPKALLQHPLGRPVEGVTVCGQLVHGTEQRGTPAVTAYFLIQSQPRISTKLASPTEPC